MLPWSIYLAGKSFPCATQFCLIPFLRMTKEGWPQLCSIGFHQRADTSSVYLTYSCLPFSFTYSDVYPQKDKHHWIYHLDISLWLRWRSFSEKIIPIIMSCSFFLVLFWLGVVFFVAWDFRLVFVCLLVRGIVCFGFFYSCCLLIFSDKPRVWTCAHEIQMHFVDEFNGRQGRQEDSYFPKHLLQIQPCWMQRDLMSFFLQHVPMQFPLVGYSWQEVFEEITLAVLMEAEWILFGPSWHFFTD